MSATIREGKMSFSVSGFGFDDVRADSGEGAVQDVNKYAMGASMAVIDETGQYAWINCHGNGHAQGLLKYDLADDFNELTHSIPTTANALNGLFHAQNVANNLGLAIQGSDWWVFDLTDETIVASGTDASLPTYINWIDAPYDCVLDGTVFKISMVRDGQKAIFATTFDYSNGTVTNTQIGINRSSGAFVNKDLVYMNYPVEWFTQNRYIETKYTDGTPFWDDLAPEGGSLGFPNVSMNGFGKKGRLYCPTFVYSAWRMGEYNGLRVPDFNTPKPIKVFGKFEDRPNILRFASSPDQKRVAFTTNIGLFMTDFEEVERITENSEKVLALSDEYLIADTNGFFINVYKYR